MALSGSNVRYAPGRAADAVGAVLHSSEAPGLTDVSGKVPGRAVDIGANLQCGNRASSCNARGPSVSRGNAQGPTGGTSIAPWPTGVTGNANGPGRQLADRGRSAIAAGAHWPSQPWPTGTLAQARAVPAAVPLWMTCLVRVVCQYAVKMSP